MFLEHASGAVGWLPGLTDLAVVPLPAVGADALVHADHVDARAAVVARVALAVVDV